MYPIFARPAACFYTSPPREYPSGMSETRTDTDAAEVAGGSRIVTDEWNSLAS